MLKDITDDTIELAAEKIGYNATMAPVTNCPKGWIEGNATCYKAIKVVGDFYQAAISCGSIGGALAVIDNPLEWVSKFTKNESHTIGHATKVADSLSIELSIVPADF